LKAYLVRHAKAQKRAHWNSRDSTRPLTSSGWLQAEGLVKALADEAPERLITSPYVRCRQTLEPLAAHLGLPLELDSRLGEGSSIQGVLDLLKELGKQPGVLCSHGDVIPGLLITLFDEGALEERPLLRCEKGSAWELEGRLAKSLRASYLEPRESRKVVSTRPPPPLKAGGGTRVAVLDMGSTSFHLLVAELGPKGQLIRVARERAMLRLGEELARSNRISGSVQERALKTALRLKAIADSAEAEILIPVATAALRDAENGHEVNGLLGEVLETPVWILDGEQEARMIFAALSERFKLGRDRTIGIDLGGGSLEIAVGTAGHVEWEATLQIGVARLRAELNVSDPLSKRDVRAIDERVAAALAPHLETIRKLRPTRCAAVGGTVRALARLELGAQSEDLPPRTVLSEEQLRALLTRLMQSTQKERINMAGMGSRRADLIPTGAAIVETVIEQLGVHSIEVCDWGLREGIILESLDR